MHNFEDYQFKRGNFFTGLMATPQFWNDIQGYHFKKEIIYNKMFHGIGIVPNVMEELKIRSVKKGGNLTIVVGSGLVIDGNGYPLFLYSPQAKVIDYKKYQLPTTLFITINYNELLEDYFQNKENPEYQGYQKKIESAAIDISTKPPDNISRIELARIRLEEDENGEIVEIKEPVNIESPEINEIDIRFVPWITPTKKGLSPYLKRYLVDILNETKIVASSANDAVNLTGLRDLQTISLTAKMLVECDNVSIDNIINTLYPIYDINLYIIQEMLEKDRKEDKRMFSGKEAFSVYQAKLHEMGDKIKYFDGTLEEVDKIIKALKAILDSISQIVETKKITFINIALISYDLPRILIVDDDRYTLVEYMDFNDHGTEKKFNFKTEVKDYTSANQQFTYPDGVDVKDVVKRYSDGKISFTIRNVVKKRKLVMIRRMDIFHGNYKVDVLLNGDHANQIIVDGYDSKNRWRNIAVIFDEDLMKQENNTFTFIMGPNGRDNFGKIWFYQKL